MTPDVGPPLLEIRRLACEFAGRRLFADVDLAVRAGEMVCLIGENGAGKSTLLAAVMGRIAPVAGEILVAGRPLASFSRRELARLIGYLPQNLPHPLELTAREVMRNAAYALDRAAPSSAMIHGLEDRVVATLSGGERLRLYFAAARVGEPRLLLLDEPLAELDPPGRTRLLGEARRAADAGAGVLFVTHDLADGLRHADRVAGLGRGRLLFDRPAAAVGAAELEALYGVAPEIVATPIGRFFAFAADA